MTFQDIPAGVSVFVDANTLIYYFSADPVLGPPCRHFLDRVLRKEIRGITTPHILSDVAHRLMTLEASALLGWPVAGIGYRLKRSHAEIAKLSVFEQAINDVPLVGIQTVSTSYSLVLGATAISKQFGLLSGDALIVAVMQKEGLTHLASNDADFDRVSGLTRYAPT
jgi:predicted nucleic acid-binding protein